MTSILEEDYYSDSALSYSKSKVYADNPLEYKHVFIDGRPQHDTPAMMFGRKFHCYLLEEHKLRTEYLTSEQVREMFFEEYPLYRSQYEGKPLTKRLVAYAEWLKRKGGPEIITVEETLLLRKMRDSALKALADHFSEALGITIPPEVILSKFVVEKAIKWQDPETGLWLKTKLDSFLEPCDECPEGVIVEFKSIDRLLRVNGIRNMNDHIYKNRYHWQTIYNREGVKFEYKTTRPPIFLWDFTEKRKDANYSKIFTPDEALIERGEQEYRNILIRYKNSIDNNIWPLLDYEERKIHSIEDAEPIGPSIYANF